MYKVVSLVLLFSVLLIGVSFTQNSYAANHPFELEWGMSGIEKPGMFLNPQHLAVDSEDNIYVTDLGNSRVQKFDEQGTYVRSWGSQGSGPGEFSHPSGIAVIDDYVFIVDRALDTVQKFDNLGNFVMQWGGFGSGNGEFRSPNGIAISDDKFVYVVDTGNNRIQKFTLDGEYVSGFGQSGKRAGNFISPIDIAVDSEGKLFVTDPGNNRINVYNDDGKFLRTLDSSVGGFKISPRGIVVDESDNIYIGDQRNNRIIQFNQYGFALSIFGVTGNSEGQFQSPKDVTVDNNGFLYVTDTLNHRIQKFSTPIVLEKLIIGQEIVKEPTVEQQEQLSEPEYIIEEQIELPLVNPVPNDFTKPLISVPSDVIIEATGALTPVNVGNAMASDESGILSLSNNASEEFPIGITTIIWTAIDGAGNMAIESQNIIVQDTIPPEIEQLKEIRLEAKSETENLVQLKTPTISDVVGVISIESDAPAVFPLGETTVTWTATDVMRNVSTMQQKVVLIDSTSPRVDIPEDIIVEATSINDNSISLIEPEVFDHVKVESLSNDAPQSFPLGETIVTWMVADSSGNVSTSSHKVIVVDTTSPEIFINNVTLEGMISSGSELLLPTPQINDIDEVIVTNNAPTIFPFGETIVTWTATDQSGNVATKEQSVNVVDTIRPLLVIPDDIEVEANGINTIIDDLGELTVNDISDIAYTTNDAPEKFPLGETIVTWAVSDIAGNSVSGTQLVTVVDTTLPEIIAPSDIKLEAVDLTENYIELVDGRVFDTVEIKSVENNAPETFPLGETIVTWTATDTSGNSVSDTQTITIEDTTQPVITGPDNITLEIIDSSGMVVDVGQASALDQVDTNPEITNDAPELFQLGDTIVTWTATDSSGNSSLFFQTITVVDTEEPELIPPENIIQEAENPLDNFVILGMAETSDIVGVSSITNDAPEKFPLGETIVTWTASDNAGNSVSGTQLVTVVDTTSPSIDTPENIVAEATGLEGNSITLENSTAEDKIEVSSITNDAPETFPLGETIVTWIATDSSGNSVSETQLVTVVDTTSPSIDTPENIVAEATGFQRNMVELGMINVDDNVGVTLITNNAPETFELGLTTITWTASDNAGNTATVQQQVSLIDTTIPSITSPNDIEIEAESNDSNIVEIGIAIASDAVQLEKITNDAPETFPLGETIVTWTATDSSGNSVSETQLVTVVDTTSPSILQLEDIVTDATSSTSNIIEMVSPVADDIISDVIVTNNAPNAFPFGETVVTWTAEDESGNISQIDQKIIVVDNSPPELQISGDIIFDAISLENIIELDSPQISDIIDTQPIITNDAPETFPLGETIVTWTASDNAGNSVSETQLINVQICGNSPSYYNMILGTAEDNFLSGTSLPDLIFGYGGDDIIMGNNGNDCIFAGEGNDIIFGNGGDDNISGDQGNDMLKGDSGEDVLKGGVGLDMIDGGDDIDTCIVVEEQNSDLVVKCETNE
jgi:sugar lactone lactonase YvrE